MITLTGKIRILSKPKVSSNLEFWQDVREGDIFEIKTEVRDSYYRHELVCLNKRNELTYQNTVNKFCDYLRKMEYEQIEDLI